MRDDESPVEGVFNSLPVTKIRVSCWASVQRARTATEHAAKRSVRRGAVAQRCFLDAAPRQASRPVGPSPRPESIASRPSSSGPPRGRRSPSSTREPTLRHPRGRGFRSTARSSRWQPLGRTCSVHLAACTAARFPRVIVPGVAGGHYCLCERNVVCGPQVAGAARYAREPKTALNTQMGDLLPLPAARSLTVPCWEPHPYPAPIRRPLV